MATFYEEMQDVADELLTEFAQGTVTLTRTTPGTPPNEWTPATDSTVTYLLKATVKAVEDKFIDGTVIRSTDNVVTASPIMTKTHVDGVAVANEDVALEVLTGDTIKIDARGVGVVKHERIPKAGTAVAWRIIVRG